MFRLSHLTLNRISMQLLLAIHIKPHMTFHRAGCPHEKHSWIRRRHGHIDAMPLFTVGTHCPAVLQFATPCALSQTERHLEVTSSVLEVPAGIILTHRKMLYLMEVASVLLKICTKQTLWHRRLSSFFRYSEVDI